MRVERRFTKFNEIKVITPFKVDRLTDFKLDACISIEATLGGYKCNASQLLHFLLIIIINIVFNLLLLLLLLLVLLLLLLQRYRHEN